MVFWSFNTQERDVAGSALRKGVAGNRKREGFARVVALFQVVLYGYPISALLDLPLLDIEGVALEFH